MSPRRSGKTGSFPIVAVGASAGGLEAFTQLLRALPDHTGMGFVFVQHLNPVHRSFLPQLLAKETKMPVLEATNAAAIQPDHVYVIPPNTSITIDRRRLRLSPRARGAGSHTPIDGFMESLARAQRNQSIGVVLSGTASDGTRGVVAIKAAGGLTLVQDEKSAKYSGMPHSAIASGSADFVLPPDGIARELARIGAHSYMSASAAGRGPTAPRRTGTDQEGFQSIFALLREAAGVDFSRYKPGTIQRRTRRRMALQGIERIADYARYLAEHPDEVQQLFRDLLIPVTSFFRNPDALVVLRKKAFPAILKHKTKKDPIRIWTPGCSSGEETYSLAILLLEFLGDKADRTQIQLFGTDANERGIDTARAGFYPDKIAQEVSPERLQRFFTKVTGGYRVSEAIRRLCVFAKQNVIDDPPFSQMDLICCRNMVIYFGADLQRRLGSILHYALKPSGFLLLGSGDSVAAFPRLFAPSDKKHKLYVRTSTTTKVYPEISRRRQATGRRPLRDNNRPAVTAPELDRQHEADRVVLKKYAPPGVVIDENLEVIQFRGAVGPFVEPAPGKASLHLMKLANRTLLPALRVALSQAQKATGPVKLRSVEFRRNGRLQRVDIAVESLGTSAHRRLLVLFQPSPGPAPRHASSARGSARTAKGETARLQRKIETLEQQLDAVVVAKDESDDEYHAANEELLSMNEEFQSTNEELEASREELQSTNEELLTVNDELRRLNVELQRANADFNNVLGSTSLPIVMVDQGLRIRHVTVAAERTFNILPTDVGRPITDVRSHLTLPHVDRLIGSVIETPVPIELEVRDGDGHWFSLQIRPYRTAAGKTDGAVILLADIDAAKRASELIARSKQFLETILFTVREPLLVLDQHMKVLYANHSFLETFGVSLEETEGTVLGHLGHGAWNIPALQSMLEAVAASGAPAEDFDVERAFPSPIGVKSLVLNARRLVDADDGMPRILLAIEDATDRKRAQALIEHSMRELEALVEQRTASLQRLSIDLIRSQDSERRRIARDLHDSIGQQLALAKLAVDTALASAPARLTAALLEIAETLERCWSETRTISHLLHPPILDELGFVAAARLFVKGFSERSGVHISIRMPHERALEYPAGELVLFRVLQESLTNVHRHSGSTSVDVQLTVGADDVTLAVKDHRTDTPSKPLQQVGVDDGAGMGLKGMRERVRELGGQLQIESDLTGTLIRAIVPRRAANDGTEKAAQTPDVDPA